MQAIKYRITLDTQKSGTQKILQGFSTGEALAREIIISLTENGDPVELDEEHDQAIAYVTPEGAASPSINECTIEDNTVIYNVLQSDIAVEGITKIQINVHHVNADNDITCSYLSPRFALEVLESDAQDSAAETSPTYTALEKALTQAKAVYEARILSVEFDENYVFHVKYADGTEYVNDDFADAYARCISSAYAAKSSENAAALYRDIAVNASNVAISARNVSESCATQTEKNLNAVQEIYNEVMKKVIYTTFSLNYETGHLQYDSPNFIFLINQSTGHLTWEYV